LFYPRDTNFQKLFLLKDQRTDMSIGGNGANTYCLSLVKIMNNICILTPSG